jgi:hypothetical protein
MQPVAGYAYEIDLTNGSTITISRNIRDTVNVSIWNIHAEKEKTGTPKEGGEGNEGGGYETCHKMRPPEELEKSNDTACGGLAEREPVM